MHPSIFNRKYPSFCMNVGSENSNVWIYSPALKIARERKIIIIA